MTYAHVSLDDARPVIAPGRTRSQGSSAANEHRRVRYRRQPRRTRRMTARGRQRDISINKAWPAGPSTSTPRTLSTLTQPGATFTHHHASNQRPRHDLRRRPSPLKKDGQVVGAVA